MPPAGPKAGTGIVVAVPIVLPDLGDRVLGWVLLIFGRFLVHPRLLQFRSALDVSRLRTKFLRRRASGCAKDNQI